MTEESKEARLPKAKMTPAECLRRAATLLETTGWVQKQLPMTKERDGEDGYCAVGAIREASGYYAAQPLGDDYDLREAIATSSDAEEALLVFLNLPGVSLSHWNDRPDRTKEEVIKKMREAADTLDKMDEAEESPS